MLKMFTQINYKWFIKALSKFYYFLFESIDMIYYAGVHIKKTLITKVRWGKVLQISKHIQTHKQKLFSFTKIFIMFQPKHPGNVQGTK